MENKKNPPTEEEIHKAYKMHLEFNMPMISATAMMHQAQAIENLHLETELTIAHKKVQQLESRIKELEQTIENMKAIAGEKIEPINVVSSVDYTTELITNHEGSFYQETVTKCCGIGPITRENFCPNCGRKIVR